MTEQELQALACELSALTVFRQVLDTPPMAALMDYLSKPGPTQERLNRFGRFVFSLAQDDYAFSTFLCRAVYGDENRYVTGAAQKAALPGALVQNARAELRLFSRLTHLTAQALCEPLRYGGYIPQFENTPVDFETAYGQRLKEISRYGYGVFSTAWMFRVQDGQIVPVPSADPVTLDQFVGYEEPRAQVLENTHALALGRTAANVLLFGDAGTGKSSTVKACANHFAPEGVRLVELRKDQLFFLPELMGRIASNPLKFIIFIDDLSFNRNDDSFSMLKAALEGSASAKAPNAVIYATSNRRHIVKETFSERSGADDVHRGDTMQELLSLSDRFGLTVYFEKPGKPLYLQIVHQLAARKGIPVDGQLDLRAEAFALQKGFRSPRAAEQFINSLL